ncbi:Domain of uncharacterised function (DUF3784) [uncultured Ruminococcus sp.]|uniref:DUF3784 domain-containing protein n=1 Tax=Massiliimalia timonensis TaxID=1987501 RepID=A0A8J6P345_9FIRM|nr:DUF3784 domain-containing protein [Massiliimalia timonensis]MBC8611959.1 DUF3784 domain-containing protein [Massiliimalia timonensis]MBS7176105.1 DUF3784 domain-containing protein [Clostridiales bacterium]SCG95858.1 Domain of uncharacterised function (DUF3784) [uncultured Clostridium sp.]SCH91820.1 Domain of uncharacterised function (DUF3784) [uncultured Ruminococcus sp.]
MAVYVIAAVFLLLSFPLLFGKGSWLIAGYNTASEKERRKYDEKKLCRTMGVFLLFVGGIILAIALADTLWFAVLSGAVICAAVIVLLIYANIGCKRK